MFSEKQRKVIFNILDHMGLLDLQHHYSVLLLRWHLPRATLMAVSPINCCPDQYGGCRVSLHVVANMQRHDPVHLYYVQLVVNYCMFLVL
jgi:hypothetical protein